LIASHITEVDVEMATAALKRDAKAPPFAVARAAAGHLVEQQWPRVVRLAGALLQRERLDYAECRRIATARR
jgi:hypothetical protein